MLYQEAVDPAGFLELLVGAQLDDLALRDDGDDVGFLDGAQPVRDHQHGAVLANLVKRILNNVVTFRKIKAQVSTK